MLKLYISSHDYWDTNFEKEISLQEKNNKKNNTHKFDNKIK